MNPFIVGALLLAAFVTVTIELFGVWRKGKYDTYSELVWWVRDRLPKPVWWGILTGMAAFFGWTIWHFGWQG